MEKLIGASFILLTLVFSCVNCSATLEYVLSEEEPANTFIGNIEFDASLGAIYDSSELEQLRYTFLSAPGTNPSYFNLDSVTGVLRTAGPIDRDAICSHQDECYLDINIAIGPSQFFQVIGVKVMILDINDNAPMFMQRETSVAIPESSAVGTSFPLPIALDPDSGINSLKSYEIDGQSENFELYQFIGPGENSDLSLVLKKELDREKVGSYQLRVLALDDGEPPYQGTLLVNVSVVDANDNHPIFRNSTLNVIIPESLPVNQTFITVHADDPDAGENGMIIYELESRTQMRYGNLFAINPNTGGLYVKTPLDYETENLFHLTVSARDLGPGSQPARATVVVTVTDVNDNAPQITVNTLTEDGLPQVLEHTPRGEFVAHILASDADQGIGGEVTCSLESALDSFEMVYLEDMQYKIITTEEFDREVQGRYNLMIRCHDNGTPQQISENTLIVTVTDINDHWPTFAENSYHTTMIENNPPGAYVVQVNATDLDSGLNGEIHYYLVGDVSHLFQVDDATGIIKTKDALDYEMVHDADFKVVAHDLGQPEKSATADISVTILDVNDNPPEFVLDQYSFNVGENQIGNAEVGSVQAIDKDSPSYSVIEYALAPHGSIAYFDINAMTGDIRTSEMLDRESVNVHYLVAVATNPDKPQMSSTVSITIYVGDENDNSPVIEFPTSENTTFMVYNDVHIGFMITQVIAVDIDYASNSDLVFSIADGDPENLFSIDPETGVIRVNKDLLDVPLQQFTLKILVRDMGSPQRVAWTTVRIALNESLLINIPPGGGALLTGTNKTIVISLATASVFIVIILIASIFIIKSYDRRSNHKTPNGQNVRVEVQKMLGSKEDLQGGQPAIVQSRPDSTNPKDVTITVNGSKVSNGSTQNKLSPEADKNKKNMYSVSYQTAALPKVHFVGQPANDTDPRVIGRRPSPVGEPYYQQKVPTQAQIQQAKAEMQRQPQQQHHPPQQHPKQQPTSRRDIPPSYNSAVRGVSDRAPNHRHSFSSKHSPQTHLPPCSKTQPKHSSSFSSPNPNTGTYSRQPPKLSSFQPHSSATLHPKNCTPASSPSSSSSLYAQHHPVTSRLPPQQRYHPPPSSKTAGPASIVGAGSPSQPYPSTSQHNQNLDVLHMSEGEMEIQRILAILEAEDAESTISRDGSNTSNTDSGKGPSEEGEGHTNHLDVSNENLNREKLMEYLSHLNDHPLAKSGTWDPKHPKYTDPRPKPSRHHHHPLMACVDQNEAEKLPTRSYSRKNPPQFTTFGHSDARCGENKHGDDAIVPTADPRVFNQSNASLHNGSSTDVRDNRSLASVDAPESSICDVADDATTTSGSYVVDFEDIKYDLEQLGDFPDSTV